MCLFTNEVHEYCKWIGEYNENFVKVALFQHKYADI